MASTGGVLKRFAFSAVMVCLTILFILVTAEMTLRLSGKVAVQGLHTASEEIFEQIPGVLEPGQDFIYRKKAELPFHVSINSLGYRGHEMTLKKNNGAIRVLCLGDSNTFGEFVNDEDTFPYKLQKLFDQQYNNIEIINGGVGGSTIIDQLFFLKKSMKIEPDIVILTFFLNDITDLDSEQPLYISLNKNRKLKESAIFGSIYKFFGDTALFQLTLRAREWHKLFIQGKVKFKNNELSEPSTIKNEEILRKKYIELLDGFYDYLQKNSVKLIFVALPSHHQIGKRTELSDLHDFEMEWIANVTTGMGIPTVNLLKFFKKSNMGKEQLYLLPYDGHPSSLSYEIMAKVLFESLQKNFPEKFHH
jgi:lysophospholipase L1-like esterase